MLYLTPLGYDPSHVISGLVECGVEDDDRVVLVIPETNTGQERYETARQEVEQFLDRVSRADLEVLPVDHTDFEAATLDIAAFIAEQDDEIFLNASQAAREILLATVLACLFRREQVADIVIYSNVDRSNLDAALPFPATVSDSDRDRLASIEEGMSIGEFADARGIDKSTASRRIKSLREQQLIDTTTEGRQKGIYLTFTGKLYREANR